ncbi:MAG: hypothetical protein K1X48_09145 [Burkholderiaceae bacterium]|nr:hypothetical protein [Burkholderiaceae bacterium]
MYIVAIGWLYVALMMALTEHSLISGISTFLFYGLGPLSLLMYLLGTPQRWRRKKKAEELARASYVAQQQEISRNDEAVSSPPPSDKPNQ